MKVARVEHYTKNYTLDIAKTMSAYTHQALDKGSYLFPLDSRSDGAGGFERRHVLVVSPMGVSDTSLPVDDLVTEAFGIEPEFILKLPIAQ